MLLTLMFNTGARVSEIIGVRVADVVLGPTSCVRLRGKERKQRSLPLWKETAREVRGWLRLNPQLEAGSALPPRRDGEPMTRANVTQRLRLAVVAATATRISCPPKTPIIIVVRPFGIDLRYPAVLSR